MAVSRVPPSNASLTDNPPRAIPQPAQFLKSYSLSLTGLAGTTGLGILGFAMPPRTDIFAPD